MVEQPFTLYIGEGISIQGRIDAVFEREDGVWEVIDYKSGRSDPDPLQLAIYSRAIEEIWGRRTRTIVVPTSDRRRAGSAGRRGSESRAQRVRRRTQGAAMKSVIMSRA